MAYTNSGRGPWLTWIAAWVLVVFGFALQWFAYDAALGVETRFLHYLWWSSYIWGVLTPLVLKAAVSYPIKSENWTRTVPLHIGLSLALVGVAVFAEAMLGKLDLHRDLSVSAVLRHYFARHSQVTFLTYWILLGAAHLYRMREEGHGRELRFSQLEAQLSAAQLAVLRSQIHPHFLFNTLQAASTLIHDDPNAAEDILLRLSELLRVSMNESHVQEVALLREIEVLELYIGIQHRRFGDRLHFEVYADPAVHKCIVPAFILQPLVENAVQHGVGKHKGKDNISVRVFEENSRLQIEVINLNSRLEDRKVSSGGLGLANTRARLEELYGANQELRLQGLVPSGVCVRLRLPLHFAPISAEELQL
jgi:two-component system LytT family sensor kinase